MADPFSLLGRSRHFVLAAAFGRAACLPGPGVFPVVMEVAMHTTTMPTCGIFIKYIATVSTIFGLTGSRFSLKIPISGDWVAAVAICRFVHHGSRCCVAIITIEEKYLSHAYIYHGNNMDGKGLPPDFDFTKNMTSFGLLMVNLLSSQLHGTVRLNSVDGTEFTIAFPIKIHKE